MKALDWGHGTIYYRNHRYQKYSNELGKRDAKNLASQVRKSGKLAHYRQVESGKYVVYTASK